MRLLTWKIAFLIPLAFPIQAETVSCGNIVVSVNTQHLEYAKMTCEAAKHAEALFEQCNVPSLTHPLRIDTVENLEPGCVGLYHCGEDWIELVAPPLMETIRDSDSAFAFLPIERYFQSIVVHELAHAAFDHVPCPFRECIATSEYVAYAMQVMSLTPDEQLAFVEKAALNRPISRDELVPVLLFMAPGLFAQKAWTHLSQRDDPCGFIGQLSEGKILLDRERF